MTRSLVYTLVTTGGNIDALLDSGADLSLINADVVRKRGIPTDPLETPLFIICADKSKVPATRCVSSLPLSRGSWRDMLRCVVVPNLSSPLMLGRDWLHRWNPLVDWVTGALTLSGSGAPWLPKGDHEDLLPCRIALKEEPQEMTPSAFRKWWRVTQRQRESNLPPPCLVFVRATESATASSVPPQSPDVVKLMEEYPRVFEEATGVEANPPVTHPIRLQEGARPCHVKPYRFSESQKNEMKEQISTLLQKGWIRPSSSPWRAPVLLVPKKDGTWRFCVDFRNLNAVTVRDSFPLPRIDDLLHKVGQATMFSKMDMQSGFHQVPMEEDSIATTAFSLPETVQGNSHFEWIVMPFGLMNAPSTF